MRLSCRLVRVRHRWLLMLQNSVNLSCWMRMRSSCCRQDLLGARKTLNRRRTENRHPHSFYEAASHSRALHRCGLLRQSRHVNDVIRIACGQSVLCVCLLVTRMSRTKTVVPIDMPFGGS